MKERTALARLNATIARTIDAEPPQGPPKTPREAFLDRWLASFCEEFIQPSRRLLVDADIRLDPTGIWEALELRGEMIVAVAGVDCNDGMQLTQEEFTAYWWFLQLSENSKRIATKLHYYEALNIDALITNFEGFPFKT